MALARIRSRNTLNSRSAVHHTIPYSQLKEPAAPLLLASTLLQLPVPDLGRAAVKRTSAERFFFYLPLPPLAQSPSHSPILMFLQLTFFQLSIRVPVSEERVSDDLVYLSDL